MVQEDFLHYLWKFQFFTHKKLFTTNNDPVQIFSAGEHNLNSGPDFFNAKVLITQQLWAGNVEIHVKSSDWYVHQHEKDSSYDNVILHVVWQHDVDIYRANNSVIPTIELQSFTSQSLLLNYHQLFSKKPNYIHCENDISKVDEFTLNNWLEKLYIEKLVNKSNLISVLLAQTKNDWEAVLFKLLTKNFGLKVNGEAFLNLSNSFDFSILRKEQNNLQNLEALLFGQAGLLQEDHQSKYFQDLKKEYQYLSRKYNLDPLYKNQFQFFRLRPNNFPTIRIAQLANLYFVHKTLFSKILNVKNLKDYYAIFSNGASEFWKTHYNFDATSKRSVKSLTKSFIDLLLINTIVPLLFVYGKRSDKWNEEKLFDLLRQIKPEKNNIIHELNKLNINTKNAFETQALLQLKSEYCDKHLCMQCAVGNVLLRKK
ncbi:MAG: DUF2851 family protein [Flavobacteriaceae bacterium]|nr:DUF2851 family protein [Flavobacteriaceae bacterium]